MQASDTSDALAQIRRAGGRVPEGTLRDAVDRVVRAADPDRILLFGSAARGEMRSDSDIDLLVVKGGSYDRHRLLTDIYDSLAAVATPVQVVLVTPDETERYRGSFCLVIHHALREGKCIYERAALRSG